MQISNSGSSGFHSCGQLDEAWARGRIKADRNNKSSSACTAPQTSACTGAGAKSYKGPAQSRELEGPTWQKPVPCGYRAQPRDAASGPGEEMHKLPNRRFFCCRLGFQVDCGRLAV